jgi:transposase-like protein
MQAALEAEVADFLGRDRYQRAAACPDANGGSRNGYRPVTVKTTTGPVALERPKLAEAGDFFEDLRKLRSSANRASILVRTRSVADTRTGTGVTPPSQTSRS